MKVAVFGASLSAQHVASESRAVTGYAEALRCRHGDRLGIQALRRITHPSNRLSDGGLVGLQQVLKWRPDVCVVEPLVEDLSRGRDATVEELTEVYRSLVAADILPLTLLAPHPSTGTSAPWPQRAAVKRVLDGYGLPSIDPVLPLANAQGQPLFRGVHTTPAGAGPLADAVADALAGLGDDTRRQATLASLQARAWPTPAFEVRALRPFEPGPCTALRLRLRLPQPGSVRLVQRQHIGPHSPVLKLRIKRADSPETLPPRGLTVWDPHCHYERLSYVLLFDDVLPAGAWTLTFRLAEDPVPDRRDCRREGVVWPPPQALELRPDSPVHLIAARDVEGRIARRTGEAPDPATG